MVGADMRFNMTSGPADDGRRPDGDLAKVLSPAARRALAEAEARRQAAALAPAPPEQGGPSGLEPTRYGDWERKGRAVDF
jgi:hypothetical protein